MAASERKIVHIDEEKCNGCGICVNACHEGAIQMVNGKARLVSDIYCDGLGDCLGPCPTGAISIITRAADEYDAEAVAKRQAEKQAASADPLPCGCPGSMARELKRTPPAAPKQPGVHSGGGCPGGMSRSLKEAGAGARDCGGEERAPVESELMNWPVQLRLVPPSAPYLKGADILLAADCTAFAAPDFHTDYLKNKPVIIACPKLEDNAPQVAKLTDIVKAARPASITVLRMEVPCCGGLARVAQEAVNAAGIDVPVKTIVLGVDGIER